ncbi:YtxH domain-containing protein [Flavobacterium gyeonganense]|uniref:YtxH domain-containing protein n=1 Tax=Flavobacterium gyeonganense TaxID=1310418 RepID=A0ABV5HAC5_9FLAO|nr:YtxH domain-containing protein [Flavobacterium gyeonganense]
MGLSSFFKNLFGKNQERSTQIENPDQHTGEKAYIEKTENLVEETLNKLKEVSEPILEDAAEFTNHAKDILSEYAEKTADSINDIVDAVKESIESDDKQPIVYDTVVDISEKPITETD